MKKENTRSLAHIIGRAASTVVNFFSYFYRKTVDETAVDYAFWDKFRRGILEGYELAGAMSKSISETMTAWVIGRGISVEIVQQDDKRMEQKVKYTNDLLRRFLTALQSCLSDWHNNYLDLGDLFLIVNPDGSIDEIPPNTVNIVLNPENPKELLGYEVVTVTNDIIITEQFMKDSRVRKTEQAASIQTNPFTSLVATSLQLGAIPYPVTTTKLRTMKVERFPNPIGRFPIVHFAQGKGSNETRGHPVIDGLRKLLSEFDDVTNKGIQGTKVSGNPVPVFEGLDDPEETIRLNSSEDTDTYLDNDGNEQTRTTLKWDEAPAIVLGAGGKFGFASPPVGFTTDITNILKFILALIRNAMHTPAYVWGGSEDASLNAPQQVPAWVKFIEGRRDKFAGRAFDDKLGFEAYGGLYELIHVWLLIKRLTDPKIIVAPTVIRWSDLTEVDEKITLDKIKWAQSRGYMDGIDSLRLLNLVENVEQVYERGQVEMEKMQELMMTTDFGGTGNPVDNPPMTSDGTPDARKGGGAKAPRKPRQGGGDTPRGPAYGGGGKVK